MDFAIWARHFEANAVYYERLGLDAVSSLSPEEKDLICDSIQQFQKGESSEGKHLFAFAKSFGDAAYLDAVKFFIREEQNHAKVLGRFMEAEGIPKIREHWVDTVFRRMRKFAGLEMSITVLLTAEIVSAVYYRALHDASASPLLREICAQILRDEEIHINFQSYTLRTLGRGRRGAVLSFVRLAHRALMFGTGLVVWLYHSDVLMAGGFDFEKFIIASFHEFDRSDLMIRGRKPVPVPVGEDMIYA